MKNLFIFTTEELRLLVEAVDDELIKKSKMYEYDEDFLLLFNVYDILKGALNSKINSN